MQPKGIFGGDFLPKEKKAAQIFILVIHLKMLKTKGRQRQNNHCSTESVRAHSTHTYILSGELYAGRVVLRDLCI